MGKRKDHFCEICGCDIEPRVIIDGIKRNLSNRKRCLDCSPFISRVYSDIENGNKFCSKCNTWKEIELFSLKYSDKDIRQSICKDCQSLYTKSHYKNNREYYLLKARENEKFRKIEITSIFVEYLSDKKCIDCGESNMIVLEFDHVSGKKLYNISDMVRRLFPMNKILEEIAKCEIVCANCHRIRTANRR